MKSFLKMTLATIVGIMLTGIVCSIMGIITLSGILMMGSTVETKVPDDAIFKLNLNGELCERAQDNPLASLMGDDNESIGLLDIVSSIKKAKENDKIKGIYIEAGSLSAAPASLQTLRAALADFKESGKFVVAYADSYTQPLYYLCSVADKVAVNPRGVIDWHGLSSQIMFFKEAMDKFGVKMQIFKVGTYKSAVEPFIGSKMSDANREQTSSFLGSIWNDMCSQVSASRGISTQELNRLADSYTAFAPAESYLASHLADTLLYADGMKEYLKSLTGRDDDESLNLLSLEEMKGIDARKPKDKSGNVVAVYYASGDIAEEPSPTSLGEGGIYSTRVCKDLSRLRNDDDVKAVVLRVNSPGGSAYASEQIWREVTLLKEKKPVIVSMGDYAASGGYYISCAADSIFACRGTLTGSIGIFGMFPDVSELLTEKIGIKYDGVSTNKMSDLGRIDRPLNADESALIQGEINRGYELFVNRCAQGRGMSADAIKAIAEGRVWTGEQALANGLVDAIGGIDEAVAAAAAKAGIESYTLLNYPEEQNKLMQLLNTKKDDYMNGQLKSLLGEQYQVYSLLAQLRQRQGIQARLPYMLTIK